jgi:O-antigen ligase
LITLQEAEAHFSSPPQPASRGGLGVRLLHSVLFLTILISFLVFIEPSPYEFISLLLGFTCLLAGLRLDRKLLPLIILLLLYNLGGAFALIPVINDEAAVRFVAVSFYLAITAIIFATIFSTKPDRRAAILRTAYIIAGVCVAITGIIGYFKLVPGAEIFTLYNRAKGSFKDPNVYGPFMVLPMLFLLQAMLIRGVRISYLIAALTMAVGLFLSFSRAAWAHMVFSAVMMIALMFVTSDSIRFRARLVSFTVMATLVAVGMLGALLAVGNVGTVFKERATLTQYYDKGESGRFANQRNSISELIELPNGYGPLQFRYHFSNDPHQVYLNAFASYGWLGGFSYLTLVLLTLWLGFRTVFVRTPWQSYCIATVSTFTGVALEGLVIDTDHWRHYFLLVGMIWGFAIATINWQRRNAQSPYLRAAI